MMDQDAQLKIQAYLDGELPEAEAQEIDRWLAEDEGAAALLLELGNTRKALAGHDQPLQLPETREFFWSKIEREILRQESPQTAPQIVPWWIAWRRLLMPVGGTAALVLAALIAGGLLGGSGRPAMETAAADTGALTYRDDDGGNTLVWLSYPAENEFAESQPASTLQ